MTWRECTALPATPDLPFPHYLESNCLVCLVFHSLGVELDVVTCCLPSPALPPVFRRWISLWDETHPCAPCGLPSYGHHPMPLAVSLLEAETSPALGAQDEVTLLLYCNVLQRVVTHSVLMDLRTLQLPWPICHHRDARR